MSASYGIQMWMPTAGSRAFDAFQAVECPIPAVHVNAPAGSWSQNDLTTRKPGQARLTSASAT